MGIVERVWVVVSTVPTVFPLPLGLYRPQKRQKQLNEDEKQVKMAVKVTWKQTLDGQSEGKDRTLNMNILNKAYNKRDSGLRFSL